ncbi:unnamed protein product [Prorocentrum cordatum]|uniref:Uncharacterized protein n=1 Tax=Prorocentrum cordatum TaxID=2364126 RepID=A0ABN9SMK6_9DINO|nr:unnamed protein product [Polarella glacialis]
MPCLRYLTAALALVDAQAVKLSTDYSVGSTWPAVSGKTEAADSKKSVDVDHEWFQGVSTSGGITCKMKDQCVVGSGLGDCKVMVDPTMAIPLSSTDSGHACDFEFNHDLKYSRAARNTTPTADITITGYESSSHWNLCWTRDTMEADRRALRGAVVEDYCYYVSGLCFLWASPCSGGCSKLREFSEYKWFCPGLRYATPVEFSTALPTLNANRKDFYSKCASEQLDPQWSFCDYANEFVRVEDDSWNELVLVCDGEPQRTQAPGGRNRLI